MTTATKFGEYPSKPSMGSLFGEWGSAGPSLFNSSNFFNWVSQTSQASMQTGGLARASNINGGGGLCHIRL